MSLRFALATAGVTGAVVGTAKKPRICCTAWSGPPRARWMLNGSKSCAAPLWHMTRAGWVKFKQKRAMVQVEYAAKAINTTSKTTTNYSISANESHPAVSSALRSPMSWFKSPSIRASTAGSRLLRAAGSTPSKGPDTLVQ